ncbi:MAG: flagellar hook-basal body complex protein [Bacteroidetes bacterium]|nr:flagellar hook-basal body complex protein [Bacteroidota bacterium]MBU1115146.1 flagellar hook-basal body complex protein [Bacteroidota bacterium]MBU1799317.1 flagellar hook-basal body complex protein [Bacteroidota bacterium]
MALLNSLFSGVSGLRNHQAMMDVIGNNIANVNTIGYKGSRITFSDTFNQLIKSGTNPTDGTGGTNSMQVGLGMKVNSIDRNWNQGTVERTGITTDLALQGPGMFILNNNGIQQYSRAGAFMFDADGKLVNPQNGAIVQGKVANGLGEIPAGNAIQDIIIDKNLRLPAIATQNVSWGGNLESGSPTKRTDIVEMSGNYKSDATANPAGTDQQPYTIYGIDGTEYELIVDYQNTAYDGTTTPPTEAAYTVNYTVNDVDGNPVVIDQSGSQALTFDAITSNNTTSALNITGDGGNIDFELSFNDLTSTDSATSVSSVIDKGETVEDVTGTVTIYDTLGNAHSLTIEYTHIDENTWAWNVDSPSTGQLAPGANGVIKFKSNGSIESISQAGNLVSLPDLPSINFEPGSGAGNMDIKLDFGFGTTKFTQTALSSQVAALSDGSAASSLSNLNIDNFGNIVGIFSNGVSQSLAQVMVATFANLNGLTSIGDNMYQVAANAGDPRIGEPGESTTTTIQSGGLEQSNVDLSEEFTKMIISQRGFQANARVVTTADALLQEITNLIR